MKQATVILSTICALTFTTFGAARAADGDGLGPYVRGGVALGWASVDNDFVGANVSNGVNPGFNVAFGHRFIPGLAAEAEFVFVTGGDIQVNGATVPSAETQAIAFTADVKAYPFMFGSDDANGLLQPYVRVGLGGGQGKVKNAGPFSGSEGTFLGRFGGGLDMMFTENLGAYGDGSYYITTKDVIVGVGTVSVGGILRF